MAKIIKLQNNTEIIGNLYSIDETTVTIQDPFTINYIFSPKSDRPIIGLLRYMPFAGSYEISFNKTDILHMVDARSSMANYYEAILINHVESIDKSIDHELEHIVELEMSEQQGDDATDLMSALLERMNPNNNLH